jgi:hypothetical protein
LYSAPSPAKSQMPLIAYFFFFHTNGIRLFDSPPDAILLRANRGIKPLVILSFMDYNFYSVYRKIHKIPLSTFLQMLMLSTRVSRWAHLAGFGL